MKRLILASIISFVMPFCAYAGGAGGGWGVVADNQELTMKFIGKIENLSLLKAAGKTFSTIESAKDSNVTLMLQDRMVSGRILEPQFEGAVSIETEEGENVIIINEAALSEDPAESTGN
jgi:hypothetical protein